MTIKNLRINIERLVGRIEALAEIGSIEGGGRCIAARFVKKIIIKF